MVDPVSWFLQHWNDVLTLAGFGIAAITGAYQIRHYRAQEADLAIISIENPHYQVKSRSIRGTGSDLDLEHVPPEEAEGELSSNLYSFTILVENDGREPAFISDATLTIGDEEFSVLTSDSMDDSPIKVGGNGRYRIHRTPSGEMRTEYGKEVEATLRLDTTTGVIEEQIVFEYREDPMREEDNRRFSWNDEE